MGYDLRAAARLANAIEARVLCTAAQLYVSVGGHEIVNAAFGELRPGRRLDTTSLFPLYCTTKPLVAVALAGVLAEGPLDLDAPIADSLPAEAADDLRSVTLREVLTHHAGLPAIVRPPWWSLAPEPVRRKLILTAPVPHRRGTPMYSAFVGWHLLDLVIEHVLGVDLCDVTHATVVDRFGIPDCWIRPTRLDYSHFVDRLALVYVAGGSYGLRAQAGELTAAACTVHDPAAGARGSATSLGRFYEAMLSEMKRGPDVLLREWLMFTTTPAYDPVMQRIASYGLGFMRGLADQKFGRACSPSAFGHSAADGCAFGFADPESGLVVAVVTNTTGLSELAVDGFRPALIESIYEDLGS